MALLLLAPVRSNAPSGCRPEQSSSWIAADRQLGLHQTDAPVYFRVKEDIQATAVC